MYTLYCVTSVLVLPVKPCVEAPLLLLAICNDAFEFTVAVCIYFNNGAVAQFLLFGIFLRHIHPNFNFCISAIRIISCTNIKTRYRPLSRHVLHSVKNKHHPWVL